MIPCSGRGFVLDPDQRPARARPVIQGFAGCRPIDTRIQKSLIATAGAVDSVLAAVREVFASAERPSPTAEREWEWVWVPGMLARILTANGCERDVVGGC